MKQSLKIGNYARPVDTIGNTVYKITHLFKENKTDRQLRKDLKIILNDLLLIKDASLNSRIMKLEEKSADFDLVKRLLK